VRRRTESRLVECHEGHYISFRRSGERKVLWHTASRELRRHHEPLLHKFLQMAQRNGGRSPILLRHDSRRKGKQHIRDLGISLIFSLSFSFPTFFLF
jgi:hypothetical protein